MAALARIHLQIGELKRAQALMDKVLSLLCFASVALPEQTFCFFVLSYITAQRCYPVVGSLLEYHRVRIRE